MMKNGGDLESLNFALRELDGISAYRVTSKQLGYVRDKLGIKPLLLLQGGA